jgi:hypothetical protein
MSGGDYTRVYASTDDSHGNQVQPYEIPPHIGDRRGPDIPETRATALFG